MTRLIQRSYVISRVLATRDKLVRAVEPLIGLRLTAELFDELLSRIQLKLPDGITRDVLRESLLHLAGRDLSRTDMFKEAWRLAGNLDRLRLYHAAPPWNRQVADEYVPVQVTSLYTFQRDAREFAEFSFRVLAGTSATMLLQKTWSPKFCAMLATSLGFSKPWAENRFEDVRQFIGLRFYVLIEQSLCTSVPVFEKLWVDDNQRIKPGSCYTYNRELIKMRNREFSRAPCPAKLPPAAACHVCPFGLDRCGLAVHDKTFIKQKCHHCHLERWFNPQLSTRMCIGCYDRHLKGEL